ncbi:unnamed protein product [Knipowitschia caucasica]|uniref:Endoplasmic reticulum membrane sensor NFE2L1 n=1 Tax=Knipowitschia caucasica TaxID=637954 RepID=A0AAV2LI42_KNICA
MLYLKKYFTEGLIQFTILLSLIGVRVDVDSYLNNQLPPLREIILGPSSAYTQTQFHNLRNTLDGYGIHPKSVDLDHFFTTRRLLNQVRQLDRLSVPTPELNTWLVHRDSETVVSAGSHSSPSITLDNGAGLDNANSPDVTPAMRGGSGAPESTYNLNAAESTLGAVASEENQEPGRNGGEDLSKEDIDLIDVLWRQDIDLGAGREVFNYSNRQKETEEEKPRPQESNNGTEQERWRNGVNAQEAQPVDGETGESIPEQECLRLLEATFPFGQETEFPAPVVATETAVSTEDVPSTSQGVLTQLTQAEPQLDLEQQWQDIMAIMELQTMDANTTLVQNNTVVSVSNGTRDANNSNYVHTTRSTPINQDVSLHQATLPSCSQDFPQMFPPQFDSDSTTPRPTMLRLASGNSSNINSTFGATNLTGVFLPQVNSSSNITTTPILPDPFSALLEESMLDEISLLDLAMEEGFSQAQASQLEDELDSDSGLSLDSGHSPASPSSSETSCSSAASSSSTSATFSEEGAVGYSTDSEVATAETEDGAAGGYQPGFSKLCRMSYQDPSQFHNLPQLDSISHNHTYNLQLSSAFSERPELPLSTAKKSIRDKQSSKLQPHQDLMDKHASRDERRARSMKIPFTNEKIINLPVEEFNELLAKHHLSESQLALIRDIRRRGKNKMAAQNCRKRKLDTIINLEQNVQELRRNKARLLKEKMEFIRTIRQMKQKMHGLYQEVFTQLRDEEGRPYPPNEYSLQYGSDGSVLIMPRSMASAEQNRKPEKKQKDKKK